VLSNRQLRHAERVVRAFLARDYSTSSFGSRSNRDIKAELRAMLELPAEGDGDEREWAMMEASLGRLPVSKGVRRAWQRERPGAGVMVMSRRLSLYCQVGACTRSCSSADHERHVINRASLRIDSRH
jgi:hypothetical protein